MTRIIAALLIIMLPIFVITVVILACVFRISRAKNNRIGYSFVEKLALLNIITLGEIIVVVIFTLLTDAGLLYDGLGIFVIFIFVPVAHFLIILARGKKGVEQ